MPEITFTGTPAEWDAERDRRALAMAYTRFSMQVGLSYTDLATTTMPPRPVEQPYTCEQCGITDEDVYWSGRPNNKRCGHLTAESCREALKRELRALRDGPTPQYEVCGWEHWRGNKYVQTFHVSDTRDAESCKQSVQFEIIQSGGGGTAHAIYKRVGVRDE